MILQQKLKKEKLGLGKYEKDNTDKTEEELVL